MRRLNRPNGHTDEEFEINITSMLDVVFILLIFFVVTSTFVKETGLDINRPTATTVVVQEKGNIFITIDGNNQVWIDKRKIEVRTARPYIERLHMENPQGSVVIVADKESKTDTLVQIMDAARAAGVAHVAIAAEEH